jgi:hypothetical protein
MTELLFHAIKTFVNDLASVFQEDIHSVALYKLILDKTSVSCTDAVEKHIECFRQFYNENKTIILENSKTPFIGMIKFSKKIFIDLNVVYKLAENDDDIQKNIHLHLLTIAALLDPHGGPREMLSSIKSGIVRVDAKTEDTNKSLHFEGDSNEEVYLNSLIKTIESSVNPAEMKSPGDAIEKIKESGAMNDLISNVTSKVASGQLDIGKMMGTVTKMMGNLTKENPNDQQLGNIMSMMSSTMGSASLFKKT